MQFEVKGTDTSTANALRRVIIGEVVTLAIDLVTFEENTSCINDEVIAPGSMKLDGFAAKARDASYLGNQIRF